MKFKKRGACGFDVTGSVWKQGHSIKCKKRGASAMRYWQPDKERYPRMKDAVVSDLVAEIIDFCSTCSKRNE